MQISSSCVERLSNIFMANRMRNQAKLFSSPGPRLSADCSLPLLSFSSCPFSCPFFEGKHTFCHTLNVFGLYLPARCEPFCVTSFSLATLDSRGRNELWVWPGSVLASQWWCFALALTPYGLNAFGAFPLLQVRKLVEKERGSNQCNVRHV